MAQVVITVIPTPSDAEVKINGVIYNNNATTVESDTYVSILVSKSGYSTLEILDKYTKNTDVNVTLSEGDDLEPVVTIVPPSGSTTTINGTSTTTKTITTGTSVEVMVKKERCVTYYETIENITHSIKKSIYLQDGRCWFTDNSDRTASGYEQKIQPLVELQTNASTMPFWVGKPTYDQEDNTGWLRSLIMSSVSEGSTFNSGVYVATNLTGQTRSATIHLCNNSGSVTWDSMKITQDPLPACIVKESIEVGCDQTTGKLSVLCADQDTNWTIETNVNWITMSGVVGKGDSINGVSYTIAANPATTTRKGQIKIFVGSTVMNVVNVTQGLNTTIVRPHAEVNEFIIDTFDRYDITLNILDPDQQGWKLDGYSVYNYKGEASFVTTYFFGVLNPNDDTSASLNDPDWQHPEFDTNPPTTPTERTTIYHVTDNMRRLSGVGNTSLRVLFEKKAWKRTNFITLIDSAGAEIERITFDPTEEVIAQWEEEFTEPRPEPERLYFKISEIVLDVGGPNRAYLYSYISPDDATGTKQVYCRDNTIIDNKGKALKAGVTQYWGRVKKSDGTWTTEEASGKIQVVVWDRNNLSQDFQFEWHDTVALDFGESKTIKLLKRPGCKLKASDIWFFPPCSTYTYEAVDRDDGDIDITITGGATKSAAWLMAIYGSTLDKRAIQVGGSSGLSVGPKSGAQVNTQGNASVARGTTPYWLPTHPVMYTFGGDMNGKYSPPGITLMEGETRIIYGKTGGRSTTTYRYLTDYCHVEVKGTPGSISLGALSDAGDDDDWRYALPVEAISPGVSWINLVWNSDNAIVNRFQVVVLGEDEATLKSIKLQTPDGNCIPGKSYNLGFSCVPSGYSIRDYSSTTGLYTNRPGVSLFTEKDDPNNIIESCSVVTDDSNRSKSGNALYSLAVKFKPDASGRVGVRLGINDNGNRIISNTAILDAGATATGGTMSFSQASIVANIEDGAADLSQYIDYSGFSGTDSKYFWLEGSDSSGYIRFSSDGKSIIPIAPGETRVFLKYHYSGMSGSEPALKGLGSSILITSRDKTEDELVGFDIHFKVSEVRLDRSAKIYGKWASQSATGWATNDFQEQLHKLYGAWNIKDLVTHKDPTGTYDSHKLRVVYENEAGETLLNGSMPGYGVAHWWEEGTVYLAAYYGTTTRRLDRIPFTIETKDPNCIPIRYLLINKDIPDGTIPRWSDFSKWHPFTEIFQITPKDALLSSSGFDFNTTVNGDVVSEIAHIQKYNKSGRTADERYRVRLCGFGGVNIARSWRNGYANTGYDGGIKVGWPDGTAKGSFRINNITLSTTKANIRRGEYTYIKTTCTPDLDFGMKDELKYNYMVDGKSRKSSDEVNKEGIFHIVSADRRGIIVQGCSVSGTHTLKVYVHSAEKFHNEIVITLQNIAFNQADSVPDIYVRTDSDGRAIDDQILEVHDGTPIGWSISSWILASITHEGRLRTYTEGGLAVYAVLADGRLAYWSGMTKDTITGYVPTYYQPPVEPVDNTPKESSGSGEKLDLGFEDKYPITFENNASEPVNRRIKKGGTNFSLSSVKCAVEKPGIVSATCVMISGELYVHITPQKKGTTKVYVLYGGTNDYVDVEVLNGDVHVPSISYKDVTGVSLNVFEYVEVPFYASGQGVYDATFISSDNSKIVVDKAGYDVVTSTGKFLVTLKDKVSGKVTLTYNNTEILEFQVVNKYNLAFENTGNFILGIGATRYVKIYPLDDLIKASEVFVSSKNGNVEVGSVMESKDTSGKRVFVVPITYKSPGPDVLVASRKGDTDIYLEFDCQAQSVRATSISFNTGSINLDL